MAIVRKRPPPRDEPGDGGRVTKRIENDTASPSGSDESNTTEFTYAADDGYATFTAKNPTTGDQVSRYAYGTTLADSGVARSDLLRAEIYPDSDDVANPLGNGPDGVYDRFEMKYNRQGEVIERKDPAQTIHALDYDKLGRPVHDRVTALGPQVSGAVRRISRAYEVCGMLLEVTSWDNATLGAGAIVNQVRLAYNTFRQPVIEYQEHGGAVNTATSRKVQYGTAGGSGNSVRPTSITYPNGRVVVWDYSTTGSTPDALSRVARVFVDNVHVASYVYIGLGRIVQVDHPQPFIRYDLATGSGTDPYAGLDRFGRVIDCRWRDYGSGTPIDIERVQYGYDRASNRSYRENAVDTTTSKAELYGYDGMYRLKTFERGTLNAGKTALTTKTFGQQWNLDGTGNWSGFNEDTNGDGTWELGQTRVSNKVNEIQSFTNSPGPTWFAPSYDPAGNMTIAPVPSLPGPLNFRSQEFDAWNRLTKAVTATAVLGEFAYDGLNRRISKKTFSGGTLQHTRHFYYSQDWQVLEERLDSATTAERQFVWGIRYIDDLLLRDRDTNADGMLDERLYGLQDDNWNLTAVADTAGDIQERYHYDAYGLPAVLTPAFASRSTSLFDWEILYASYRWDAETKMYQVRNRWLDSRVGVWVTRDPNGYLDGLALYVYARSRVLNHLDALGTIAVKPWGPAIGGQYGASWRTTGCAPKDAAAIGNALWTACRRLHIAYWMMWNRWNDIATRFQNSALAMGILIKNKEFYERRLKCAYKLCTQQDNTLCFRCVSQLDKEGTPAYVLTRKKWFGPETRIEINTVCICPEFFNYQNARRTPVPVPPSRQADTLVHEFARLCDIFGDPGEGTDNPYNWDDIVNMLNVMWQEDMSRGR